MKTIKRKIQNKGGFSLTELLVATLIMMLATGLLTQTLSLAIDQFYRQTRESEAQLLCASLMAYLESELAYAAVTKQPDGSYRMKSDAHNMGEGIQFVYEGASGGASEINLWDTGTAEDMTGKPGRMVAETSPYYQASFGDGAAYNIAGFGAYEVGKNKQYRLNAGAHFLWDGKKWTVTVKIYGDNDSRQELAANSFTAYPAAVAAE